MTSRRLGWGVLLAVLVGGAPAPAATPDDAQRAYAAGRFEEARRLWEPRAEAGDAEAQFGLGLLFDIGQGVAQDPASAYRWYRRAAEAGMAEAQFNVAVMHDTGEGRPRDHDKTRSTLLTSTLSLAFDLQYRLSSLLFQSCHSSLSNSKTSTT